MLGGRLDWTLDRLKKQLAATDDIGRPTYVYVVASVQPYDGRWVQTGGSPNFQGDMITLCCCKHRLRTYPDVKDDAGVWLAGITSEATGGGRRYLQYLTFVTLRANSFGEMWRALPPGTRDAKSASRHRFGDLYVPIDASVAGDARYQIASYEQPCIGHVHRKGPKPAWDNDITYPDDGRGAADGRRPVLVAGDRARSWVWTRPVIRLDESLSKRFPREPHKSDSLTAFVGRLRDGKP